MLIQIIASPSKGKSLIAEKIVKMLEQAGASVKLVDGDNNCYSENRLKKAQKFPEIIKNLRESGQTITVQTIQQNKG